ncbi:hypothetical protein [Leptospira licerasiae]|uniref:Flagellar motor switch protein FliG n=1 Tax=Leptospira licerasiae str. MMD4847 TaxID=1049971 RepID=A0ABN0HBM9_9LEPT|nr:hypothetical protein [Leptospira licerasiae]EIE01771.1 hypothetical protein LEP1GSC185_3109 [Leptospira licerasiae serovar Varillal str. VAR 010]EJZ42964.1 hypothetical protein LEP1GSC178_2726 [Leptospira licerasiae str. MMD4847]
MIYFEGENYHFLFCNPDSVARVHSKISPFYDFPLSNIEELPYLYSQAALIPKFLYEVEYDRKIVPSSAIKSPPYLKLANGLLYSEDSRFPKDSEEIFEDRSYPIRSNPYQLVGTPSSQSPIPILVLRENLQTQIGSFRTGKFKLNRIFRKRMFSTKYLSLRDIVNPELNEEEVTKKIEELYFDPESKTYLFRLVKILYAGTPTEEQELVSNLFTYEIEFAKFLRDRIFSIEILPLIHGPFLNSILNKLDERILKFSVPKLSPPVRRMVEKNVSKNKWKQILDGPSKKPEPGESFPEIVEKEIFRRFSRRIYYEEGNFTVYKSISSIENSTEEDISKTEIEFESVPSEKYNLNRSSNQIELYAVTKDKILLRVLKYMDIIRIDIYLSKKERDQYEFFKISADSILEIPKYDQAKLIVGAGINSEKKPLEFSLLSFSY